MPTMAQFCPPAPLQRTLQAPADFCFSRRRRSGIKDGFRADRRQDVTRFIDYMVYNVFEPSLNWVLSHPIISVLAVGALIFFSVRNYRML
jgi:hypothetical protein